MLQIKYPLYLLSQWCNKADVLYPSPVSICGRFSENFTPVLQNVLKLVKDCDLKRLYLEARGDALAEDITGFRTWKHLPIWHVIIIIII